jgi:hypothetical protein
MRRLSIVVAGVALLAVAVAAAQTLTKPVIQVRLPDGEGEALGTAVLVHRQPHGSEMILYFVTTARLLPAAPRRPNLQLTASRPDAPDLAVIRVLSATSRLTPAAVDLAPVLGGDPIEIVGFDRAGALTTVAQRVVAASPESLTADRPLTELTGCLGAPAFSTRGVVGVVSACEQDQLPVVTRLSGALEFLRAHVPGLVLAGPPR